MRRYLEGPPPSPLAASLSRAAANLRQALSDAVGEEGARRYARGESLSELQHAQVDAVLRGVGVLVDGERVDPERLTVLTYDYGSRELTLRWGGGGREGDAVDS